jgi:hypothetical protein
MSMTYNLANQIANATLRNQSYTSPAAVYAALYTTPPTGNTTGTEYSGNGYSRVNVTFSNPANGVASSNVTVTFGPATGNNWTGITAVGVTDASTSGNLMYYQGIATRNVKIGDSLVFGVGNISVSIT